jgi:hypothetical protein
VTVSQAAMASEADSNGCTQNIFQVMGKRFYTFFFNSLYHSNAIILSRNPSVYSGLLLSAFIPIYCNLTKILFRDARGDQALFLFLFESLGGKKYYNWTLYWVKHLIESLRTEYYLIQLSKYFN